MNLQALVDAINRSGEMERSKYHLTLGKLVAALEGAPADAKVVTDDGRFVGRPISYRGHYSDLAFMPDSEERGMTAGAMLSRAKEAIGEEFEGYKGGEFTMRDDTPLWFADYGCEGWAIIAATVLPDRVVLMLKDVD